MPEPIPLRCRVCGVEYPVVPAGMSPARVRLWRTWSPSGPGALWSGHRCPPCGVAARVESRRRRKLGG